MSTGFVGYILLPDVPHNPTQTELCCLIEAVNAHSDTIAAEALGISSQTLRNHLTRLYRERRLRTSGPDPRLSLGASVPASSPIARVA